MVEEKLSTANCRWHHLHHIACDWHPLQLCSAATQLCKTEVITDGEEDGQGRDVEHWLLLIGVFIL